MDKLHIHLVSFVVGSIGEITKDLLPCLEENFILTKEWLCEIPEKRDILLCHFIDRDVMSNPEEFDKFKIKILIQPIDGTSIKQDAIDFINKFDLVITPANAGKIIMYKNNVTVPIYVIPNFYKDNLFNAVVTSGVEKFIPKNKIIFYHESTFHPRKGIELLYEGFIRAFSDTEYADKVILILKDMPYTNANFLKLEELKKKAITLQKLYKTTPEIIKFSCYLNDEELKTLWDRTNFYVSLSKIEGFGIPMLRMFLLKKAIICLKNENSGYQDYLNENNSYMIDAVNIHAQDEFMWLYDKETEWAVPNINDVIKTFKEAIDDYKKGEVKNITNNSAYKEEFKKYSLKTISKAYVDIITKTFNKQKNNAINS